jgi:hypothetical protein
MKGTSSLRLGFAVSDSTFNINGKYCSREGNEIKVGSWLKKSKSKKERRRKDID